MKKRICAALTFLLVLALTACGASKPTDSPKASPAAQEAETATEGKTAGNAKAAGETGETGADSAARTETAGNARAAGETGETGADSAAGTEAAGNAGTAGETGETEAGSTAETEPAVDGDEGLAEGGTYTERDDVALYLHLYGCLPPNFITKKEAEKLGWAGGSLAPYAPGKCIGGDRFGNYEGKLPEKSGRSYWECDIDTLGADKRGAKRIVYSNDGLVYYTNDHYGSFKLLYS